MGSSWIAQGILIALLGLGAAYSMGGRGRTVKGPSGNVRRAAAVILVLGIAIVIAIIALAPRAPQ